MSAFRDSAGLARASGVQRAVQALRIERSYADLRRNAGQATLPAAVSDAQGSTDLALIRLAKFLVERVRLPCISTIGSDRFSSCIARLLTTVNGSSPSTLVLALSAAALSVGDIVGLQKADGGGFADALGLARRWVAGVTGTHNGNPAHKACSVVPVGP
jgi:hypothetical protein